MRKKVLSLALALVMCLGPMIPALAANFGGGGEWWERITPKAGDTEVKDSQGYIYRFSNPVIGEISNFLVRVGPDEYLDEDTYYKVPVGTVVTIQSPDGTPGKFSSVQAGQGYGGVDSSSYTIQWESLGYILFTEGGRTRLYLYGVEANSESPAEPNKPDGTKPVTAMPTNDKLTVDGVAADPTVYKIDGANYFKIRDVAALLNGTSKQFAVGYDGEKKAVTATTGEGYTKLDTDLTGAPAGGNQTAAPSNDVIYVNGEKADLTVYKINGGNYFKLRDLGDALGFAVDWNREQGMMITTK